MFGWSRATPTMGAGVQPFECLTDWCAGEDDGLEPPQHVRSCTTRVVTDRSIWWVPSGHPDPETASSESAWTAHQHQVGRR